MAENYEKGVQKVFYRARQLKEGKIVTMDILDPFLNWTTELLFTEAGKGLYYLDFNFVVEGTYAALLYENGEKLTSQNFFVSKRLEETRGFFTPGFKGSSVINNN